MACLFLFENNEPDVRHILGNSKRIASAAGPALRLMEQDCMLLGALFCPGAAGCLPLLRVCSPQHAAGLGVCAPDLSLPHYL